MTALSNIRLMARYNEWMNARLYSAAGRLPTSVLQEDKKAYFGSILGTLNHIMVGDILWLKRFALHPSQPKSLEPIRNVTAPTSLDEILCQDFQTLSQERAKLDALIIAWANELADPDLESDLSYRSTKGIVSTRNLGSLIMHFFNHQTHHRGQVTTLLFQSGVDVGITDLVVSIPER